MKTIFKRITAFCLAIVFFAATALPTHAFWIERNLKLKGTWLIHCKNREDYQLRGHQAGAVEAVRSLCRELTGKNVHAKNILRPDISNSHGSSTSGSNNNATGVIAVSPSTNIYADAVLYRKLY